MSGKYDDIIDHPHYQSKTRPHMSMINRAAQFSPFAALTGYGEAVSETERLTDERIVLDDSVAEDINRKLLEIESSISEEPYVTLTYFVEDVLKEGGRYLYVTDNVVKIDRYNRIVYMKEGSKISIDDIFDIELLKSRE
ncbi:MAG: YolD-like family protein [Lachnospiraceae bacterium]|nr:YolD-like family protein [Lachnospiraceae bacterium]